MLLRGPLGPARIARLADGIAPALAERLEQASAHGRQLRGGSPAPCAARSGFRAQVAAVRPAPANTPVAEAGDAAPVVCAIRATIRDVPGFSANFLADTLLDLGAQSASVTEHRPAGAAEQAIFDLQQGSREVWDRCTVTAHFSPDHDVAGTLAVLGDVAQMDLRDPELSSVSESEWVDGICAAYQPTHVTGDLWIVPHSSKPPDPEALNVIVNPGLAFGTGEHPTTRLCLKAVHALGALHGRTVLDYGTGSGVLALAALKLGASMAVGVDTDAVAVRAAAQNGILNRFQGWWVTLQCGPGLDDPDPLVASAQGIDIPQQFDVCLANILRGPLLELQPRLSGYVKPGGVLILSGIVSHQAQDVIAAYSAHFKDFETNVEENWAQIRAVRKADGPARAA